MEPATTALKTEVTTPATASWETQAAAQADNRADAGQARALQQAVEASPRQVAQRQAVALLAASPRQVAQRQAAAPLPARPNRTGLPDRLKAGVESLSGQALDEVRVHYNSDKPAQLQAHAYAQGTDIHVAPGQEQHLPHEAWHVVQQMQGRVAATRQLKGIAINDDTGLEQEADLMGSRAMELPATTGLAMPAQLRVGPSQPVRQYKSQVLTRFLTGKQEEEESDAEEEEEEESDVEEEEERDVEEEEEENQANEPEMLDEQAASHTSELVTEEAAADEEGEDDSPHIADVVIGGRTPSPYSGTMGAHATAWVVHLDVVRRHLINTSLAAGARDLANLADEEMNSELMELADLVSGAHNVKLQAAKNDLVNANAAVREQLAAANARGQNADGDDEMRQPSDNGPMPDAWLPLLQTTRALVDAYLTFVNYLPTSTVAGGDPSGHGEGYTRGELNLFEFTHAGVAKIKKKQPASEAALKAERKKLEKQLRGTGSKKFRTDLTTLMDLTLNQEEEGEEEENDEDPRVEPLRGKMGERLWNMFAAETPGVFTQSLTGEGAHERIVRVWGLMLRNFLKSIRTAYPYSYQFARMDTLAAQEQGLRSSLKAAKIPDNEAVLRDVLAALRDDPAEEQAEPDPTGVAGMDRKQGGSGFQANVLTDEQGIIGDVVMTGRTKSPFTYSMGAHTTAWIVHLDATRRMLAGKPVAVAMQLLMARATQERNSATNQTLVLSNYLDEKHQIALMNAYSNLKIRAGRMVEGADQDPLTQTDELEQLIHEYLTFINFLPLSTINVGRMPNGRSEGQHRTFLNNYELQGPSMLKSPAEAKQKLQEHLTGMFDSKALENFPPRLGQRENRNPSENIGMPFKEHDLHPLLRPKKRPGTSGKVAIARRRFYRALLEAYPRAVMDSGLLTEVDEAGEAATEEHKPFQNAVDQEWEETIGSNNCLIDAIAQAGGLAVTREQLLDIRLRIGEVGTMLFASERVVSIIRGVLGIDRDITVNYPPGQGQPEHFGTATHNPIVIHHTGHAHFTSGPGPLLADADMTGLDQPTAEKLTRKMTREERLGTGESKEAETEDEWQGTDLEAPLASGNASKKYKKDNAKKPPKPGG